jgi:deoxyadenosine/deoxycytidine kinase
MNYNFIAIEGNIGAGKTSLARKIAELCNARLVLERFDDNPFLPKFYEEPAKYGFALELSFLAERFQQMKEELGKTDLFRPMVVSDYFFDKSVIFASKNLGADELVLYRRLFHIISASLPKPGLIVYLYLDIEKLKHNITLRGRNYEQKISEDYLQKIQQGYFEYIRQLKDVPVLIVDTNNIDFVNRKEDFNKILSVIDRHNKPGITNVTP